VNEDDYTTVVSYFVAVVHSRCLFLLTAAVADCYRHCWSVIAVGLSLVLISTGC